MNIHHIDYFDLKIHSENFVLVNATISEIENSLFSKKTHVKYSINDEMHDNEISNSSTDKVGETIIIYYDAERNMTRRSGHIYSWNVYSIMIIILFICMISVLVKEKIASFGNYKNKIYNLVYCFAPNLWAGTYSAAMKNKPWKMWMTILVWGIGMLIVSMVAKRYEIEKRNEECLKLYSKEKNAYSDWEV